MAENVGRLEDATDAPGAGSELVELAAPRNRSEHDVPLDCSYVNFSFVNGGAVISEFDDPEADAAARRPGRAPARASPRPRPCPCLVPQRGRGVRVTQHEPASAGTAACLPSFSIFSCPREKFDGSGKSTIAKSNS